MFELHPQLVADCEVVGDLTLCRVLLAKDGLYPWLILVPRRAGVTEVYQLGPDDQYQLSRESAAVARAMAEFFHADKMNIAALGNQVPQLHLHHVVRYTTDAAWPKPIWGAFPASLYDEKALEIRLKEVRALLVGLQLDEKNVLA